MKKTILNLSELIAIFRKNGALTDTQLKRLIKHYEKITIQVKMHGKISKLFLTHLRGEYDTLLGFAEERSLIK